MKKNKVTCLVPAYNEEKTINKVLTTLSKCKNIDEIIVVDDGSKDKTALATKKAGVKCYTLEKNFGKSMAVKEIVPKIKADIIFFCDADLNNLTPQICDHIIEPLLKNRAHMSIGMRDYGWIVNHIAPLLPSVSGERALFYDDVLTCIQSPYFKKRYDMETVFNHYCHQHDLKVIKKVFPYSHTAQTKKKGLIKGGLFWISQGIEIIGNSLVQLIK